MVTNNKLLYLTTAFIMSLAIEHAACMDLPQGWRDHRSHRLAPKEERELLKSNTLERINRILNLHSQSLEQPSLGAGNNATGLSLPAGGAAWLTAGIDTNPYRLFECLPKNEEGDPARSSRYTELNQQEIGSTIIRPGDARLRTTFGSNVAAIGLEEHVYPNLTGGHGRFSESPLRTFDGPVSIGELSSPREVFKNSTSGMGRFLGVIPPPKKIDPNSADLQKNRQKVVLEILRPALKRICQFDVDLRKIFRLDYYLIKISKNSF